MKTISKSYVANKNFTRLLMILGIVLVGIFIYNNYFNDTKKELI